MLLSDGNNTKEQINFPNVIFKHRWFTRFTNTKATEMTIILYNEYK